MEYIFNIKDKLGRNIHLTKERWNEHIRLEHPEIVYPEELIKILENPDKIININEDILHYYKYFKNQDCKSKYLRIIVKYLNGNGFVITAYYVRNIRI